MNTKHIIAAISVATALAIITPAYAGGLGGGVGGGLGGRLGGGLFGMSGMNRGLSGQGAFQGQGAFGGALNKPNLHPTANAVKQGSVTGNAAAQSVGSVSKSGNTSAANLAGSTESNAAVSKSATTSATNTATRASTSRAPQVQTPKPNVAASAAPVVSATAQKQTQAASLGGASGVNAMTNKGSVATNGLGSVDVEHSTSGTSVDAVGTASAAAARNPQ